MALLRLVCGIGVPSALRTWIAFCPASATYRRLPSGEYATAVGVAPRGWPLYARTGYVWLILSLPRESASSTVIVSSAEFATTTWLPSGETAIPSGSLPTFTRCISDSCPAVAMLTTETVPVPALLV